MDIKIDSSHKNNNVNNQCKFEFSKDYQCDIIYFDESETEGFECAGDEVLVESSPPASPDMAAQLAQATQGTSGGSTSPSAVRELIVIPEIRNGINLQHAIQQVSTSVVEVNGDSSGHSSPNNETQHTYIVAMQDVKTEGTEGDFDGENSSSGECEGGNGVNYHVQYVEPQDIYTQGPQSHMETLRAYPVFGVANVETVGDGSASVDGDAWSGEFTFSAAGGDGAGGAGSAGSAGAGSSGNEQPASPAPPARMPPATVQWLLDHYETAEGVSLPRSTLYAHYLRHCGAHRLEPVNAASFGKLIRSVFVGLRTRRLGTRGNSKYHYYGIRARPAAPAAPGSPAAPAAPAEPAAPGFHDRLDVDEQQDARDREQEGAVGLGAAHRQYLGAVVPPEPPELVVEDLPEDLPPNALQLLRMHHRQHGAEFLQAVAALDTAGVERARRGFWRRPPAALGRRALLALAARRAVAVWLRRAELRLHQRAVDLLLPDVLRPIPSHLTQAIRNFAKTLESALAGGAAGGAGAAGGVPALAARAQSSAAAALAGALRRYTSLNHLAQAARAVLTNHHQIQQMVSDLSRVDFRVVREQAGWACACGSAPAAHKLEADFKATLGRGASLEQWAGWLEACVRDALAPHAARPDYTARARRLLLDWSFYSSLVIRELTLRSAASFGSFHLIRLLYDEYVAFLVERRVAAHRREPPIAVMQRAMDDDDELPEEAPRGEEEGEAEGEAEGEGEGEAEGEGDGEWEWGEEEDEDDDDLDCKKARLSE